MRGTVGVVTAGLTLLAGCAGGATAPPTTTAVASSTPSASAAASGEGDAIQLLYLSDSSGWQTGEAYAALAEAELGVPVELVDWRIPNLSMAHALDLIAEKPDVVGEAEIVVVWANPVDSGVKAGSLPCFLMSGDPGVYAESDWAPFAEDAGRVLDAIWEARDREPTVVRLTDLYAPVVARWEELGTREACLAQLETMSSALRATAEAHGAIFVSALDVYNGSDRLQDPVEAGLVGGDGQHPSEAGGRAMAEALAATGFEPTVWP